MSVMENLIKNKDAEINKLLVKNCQLVDELRQCQADKEFVWSLWKRLQVSSPDLTQAISIVMEREKEKTEAKDRKVLEILRTKDEETKNLQKTISQIMNEKTELLKFKTTLEMETDAKMLNLENSAKEILELKRHLEKSSVDSAEKSSSYERMIRSVEEERDNLRIKMTDFLTEIQQMRARVEKLEDENTSLKQKNIRLYDDIDEKNVLVQRISKKKDDVEMELEDLRKEANRQQTSDHIKSHDHEQRYRELKAMYEQVEEQNRQQLNLIDRLQRLQSNTKEMISQQEETFQNEKKSLQQANKDLLAAKDKLQEKCLNLKIDNESLAKETERQKTLLLESEKRLKNALEMPTIVNDQYHNRHLNDLRKKLEEQKREIATLHEQLDFNRAKYSTQTNTGDIDQTFSPIVERGMGCRVSRSRSLSPCAQSRQFLLLQKKLKATETKLDDTKHLLELKIGEVAEMQRAHNKRLDRMKMLQQDYKCLKSARSESDADVYTRKTITKQRRRNRDVRQEISKPLWNEVTRYKQDNRDLVQEKLALEEEVDALRVQLAMDRATIHDLNVCLKQRKEKIVSLAGISRREEERLCSTPKSKSESKKMFNKNVKNLEQKLEDAVTDKRALKEEKKILLQDNRSRKDELKSLKLELTDARQSGTKLRLETSSLHKQVDRLKSENIKLEKDFQNFKSDMVALKEEASSLHSENVSLREENNELRQDIADLKLELADINAEINDRSFAEGNTNEKKKDKDLKSPSAKKHQKFLNESVYEMQAAFGNQFEPPTSASEDVARSDASSLGQSIVKTCKKQTRAEDDDEDVQDSSPDTYRSSRLPSSRVSYLSKHGSNAMLINLKHKLSSLQTQCTSLRTTKQNAIKKLKAEKEKTFQIESELTTCQNKLKNLKQNVQRLNREVDGLQREREDLQQALIDAKREQPQLPAHSDSDYKYLESRLKLANGETTRLNVQLKDAKKDVEKKMDQLTSEKEKVTRLERDVSMKRQLIDELRIKSKDIETKLKDEYNAKMDLQERLKLIEEDKNHQKTHIESIRRQLQACTKEKAKYEMMYNKTKEEIEKRCEQLSSAQASKLEAESVNSRLEQEAEHQLQALASRSKQALEKLNFKLEKSEERIGEFGTFVQNISTNLIELLCLQRKCFLQEKENVTESQARTKFNVSGNKQASSMSHAQTVACNILNMSQSDFEDLMAPVDARKRQAEDGDAKSEVVVVTQQDEMWKSKVEKIASENPPFAKSLSRLIWDKVQDVVRVTEEKCQVRTDQLEGELLNRKKF